ncbi:hypothetical protein KP77_08990 [Jeotgalibacillus alimentarius]|uniref:Uncharacterized protein n=1 Tax=Jeotgalibacillus alimentarius TaxID=135826 RepID=A0A0C2VR36_9BACL|nr:hypothetical protein [Jeotgalibacillus alimentarius]KIL51387.1 hypothetical protein KP77_08990 [Jeotgalibacillus alimentarius]
MNQDPFKYEEQLKHFLDSYHVEMPEFPVEKPGRWQRLIQWLATPVKNPLDPLVETVRSYSLAGTLPIVLGLVIAVIT